MAAEANKDDAMKCLEIAQRAREAGNIGKAYKFAEKARALYPCPQVDLFLRTVQSGASAASSQPRRRTAGSSASPSGDAPTTSAGASPAKGTPEQRGIVGRIRAAKGDYYKVLDIERSASDEDVKKAYRKLALKLHPDKCRAAGAEEAFKEVSKAFTCLADPEKRAFYDRTGHEDTASMASARAANGHGTASGMHEVDPQELFNMMFGGAGGFGMGPFGSFGGFRSMHTGFSPGGHGRQRAAQQQQQQQQQQQRNPLAGWLQLLPLLFMLLYTLLTQTQSPAALLHRTRDYRDTLRTATHGVPFYVKDADRFDGRYPEGGANRMQLEKQLEAEYRHALLQECRQEMLREQQLQRDHRFWRRSGDLPVLQKPSCSKYRKFTDHDTWRGYSNF